MNQLSTVTRQRALTAELVSMPPCASSPHTLEPRRGLNESRPISSVLFKAIPRQVGGTMNVKLLSQS